MQNRDVSALNFVTSGEAINIPNQNFPIFLLINSIKGLVYDFPKSKLMYY